MAGFFLSAMSFSSGIQKKLAATIRASPARSFFSAICASCWRNASKPGSLSGAGRVMATVLYGAGGEAGGGDGAWAGAGAGGCLGESRDRRERARDHKRSCDEIGGGKAWKPHRDFSPSSSRPRQRRIKTALRQNATSAPGGGTAAGRVQTDVEPSRPPWRGRQLSAGAKRSRGVRTAMARLRALLPRNGGDHRRDRASPTSKGRAGKRAVPAAGQSELEPPVMAIMTNTTLHLR